METCYTKKRFAQQQTNNKQRYDSTARTIQSLLYSKARTIYFIE